LIPSTTDSTAEEMISFIPSQAPDAISFMPSLPVPRQRASPSLHRRRSA
jgi:hypothetical protein